MDDDRFMLRDLRSRTCALDARDKETWSNVESIHGKCVVVTCTNLQPIPRDEDDENDAKVEQEELRCTLSPQPWKSVLELADLLLTPGGYLLQYDVAQYDFGSTLVMNDYVASHSLGLQLVECCEPIVYKNPQAGQVFLLLWQKQ